MPRICVPRARFVPAWPICQRGELSLNSSACNFCLCIFFYVFFGTPLLLPAVLRLQMEVPWYVDIIKTGTFKEQAPYDSEWYFTRAASIARTVYLKPGIGVQKFRKVYGAFFDLASRDYVQCSFVQDRRSEKHARIL